LRFSVSFRYVLASRRKNETHSRHRDDPDIVGFLRYNLEKEDFQVYAATDGKTGLEPDGGDPPTFSS
jgi:hypothetical protein